MSYPPPGGPEGGQPGGQPPPPGSPPPPPSGFPPQPPWGPPAYGYGYGLPRDHPQGTTALVLGLIGIIGGFACGLPLLLCIPAWVIGHKARRDIQQNHGAYSNSAMVTAGWILGIVGTVLMILGIAFVALMIALSASTGT